MLRSRTDHDTVLNQTKKPVANWYKQVVKKKRTTTTITNTKTIQKETNIKNGQSSYRFIFLRPGGQLSLGENFCEPRDSFISLITALCAGDLDEIPGNICWEQGPSFVA